MLWGLLPRFSEFAFPPGVSRENSDAKMGSSPALPSPPVLHARRPGGGWGASVLPERIGMSALLLQLAVCDTFGGCGEPAEPGAPGPAAGPRGARSVA